MKAFFSLIAILFITISNAQKFDCSSTITTYQEFFKVRNITDAFDSWSQVRKNCPKQSEVVYQDGILILQYKIDNAANAEEKETLVRDLMKLYDQYNKNFPETTTDFEVRKAMALHDNKIEATNEVLSLLDSGFSKASSNITNANAIYTYFSLCHEKYKAGDPKFSSEFVLDKYTLVNAMLSNLQNSNSDKANDYKTAQRGINALAKDLATCDNLAMYYEKKYELNKDNNDWIVSALTNLGDKCSAKPIFNTMAQNLYAAKATAKSAHFMAVATLKQKKFDESIQFYQESAELETNPLEKAKIYYTLGTGLLFGDKAKSKESLIKSLQANPSMGRAYLFLAELYTNGAEECGKTDFEKKAIHYLALQTAKKAILSEPKMKAAADKIVEKLASKAPTQAEINKEKMNGKSLTIGCWINETITFPAK
ncbi:tetratricopeptide repeat protein [Flavobacterium sp.]|uniref:tetratricopeptide repeat protein n=1 Tax=Flavobacterium sp. TaxID=239 RepID=UPI00391B3F05